MTTILKDIEDWENFWRKHATGIFAHESPESYPCIVQAFEYDGASQTDINFFFVYLEDAIELINVSNKQKYQEHDYHSDCCCPKCWPEGYKKD